MSDPTRTCTAKTRNGQPCRGRPILGGTVCRMHGGAAPQVKRAARERLDALVDPALTELAKLIETADSDSVKLSAIKDVLDRAGYKATDKHEHSGAVRVEVVYSDDVPGFAAAAARGADDGPR